MIERKVFGPMEFLAPIANLKTELEITGIKPPKDAYITHVFLDEVSGNDLEAMIKNFNYAGSFSVPDDLHTNEGESSVVCIDITEALKRAVQEMPNFYITFLTQHEEPAITEPRFDFETVHILSHIPDNTNLELSADVTCGLATGHKNPI